MSPVQRLTLFLALGHCVGSTLHGVLHSLPRLQNQSSQENSAAKFRVLHSGVLCLFPERA